MIKSKLPKNITVSIACLAPAEKELKQLFTDCLIDYSKRFGLTIPEKKIHVSICAVEYDEYASNQGLTSFADDCQRILIQVRDPFLNDWEANRYMVDHFVSIVCHEIVHACQFICDRRDFKIKGLTFDKNESFELYCFEPMEMEARMLEYFYAETYGKNII